VTGWEGHMRSDV